MLQYVLPSHRPALHFFFNLKNNMNIDTVLWSKLWKYVFPSTWLVIFTYFGKESKQYSVHSDYTLCQTDYMLSTLLEIEQFSTILVMFFTSCFFLHVLVLCANAICANLICFSFVCVKCLVLCSFRTIMWPWIVDVYCALFKQSSW